ncbi:T9SS type B sorting domain-containing protein [Psychroflexus aestuariivivens]|uniref:T9SS type B sorting domain-containing protein n=1 Tax=Psychroflexus aestuariivivens TaxID=1795040 RepID=UPI001F015A3A|nr:T9SS type B sorting domain-containing protein [Psychroflexus aestuariivivens]
MIQKLTILTFIFVTLSSFAQGEANNWYFGNGAGITFNTNPPSSILDGQLYTNEGCSSISNSNGDLLFYTDGRTIWNREHQIMQNADYFGATGLHGDPSSTSSGLIVPHPTSPNLYFVFTVDEPHHSNAFAYPDQGPADQNGNPISEYPDVPGHSVPQDDDGFNNGFNYSIVDINLNNGLGDVVSGERNNHLITYDENNAEDVKYKSSEKITAVRGADCNSVWVITHFKNTYYSFLIDENGINETPVESVVAPNITTDNYRRAAIGYLKASPSGQKIIVAHNTTNFNQSTIEDEGDGSVYIYDFDNATGEVSNPLLLIDNVNAYGVEFSQEATKAYATVDDNGFKLYQWDLESDDISNSFINLLDTEISASSALQLAPNGRIYHSVLGTNTLAVIQNPDALGADANYSQNVAFGAINLSGRTNTFGLPPFIQSLFSSRIGIVNTGEQVIRTEVTLCDEYSFTLSYEDIDGATYIWSKNGEEISDENDSSLEVELPPDVSLPYQENYSLEVSLNDGSCPLLGVATINFIEPPIFQEVDLLECKNIGEQFVSYDLNQASSEFLNQANLNQNEANISFYISEEEAENEENVITNISNFDNSEGLTEIYTLIKSFESCKFIAKVNLNVENFPDLDLEDEIRIYCLENLPNPITLSALKNNENIDQYDFYWSTSENTPTIQVNEPGNYSVEVSNLDSGCAIQKNIEVINSNQAIFDLEIEDGMGGNNSIEIFVLESSLGEYEYSLNGNYFQDENVFENLESGVFTVYVRDKNGCGMTNKTIGIIGAMNFFTPNSDGINDVWHLKGVYKDENRDVHIDIFDRYGKMLYSFTTTSRGWDGTYNGRKMPSNDYWYRIILADGRVLTGNFTLKR